MNNFRQVPLTKTVTAFNTQVVIPARCHYVSFDKDGTVEAWQVKPYAKGGYWHNSDHDCQSEAVGFCTVAGNVIPTVCEV